MKIAVLGSSGQIGMHLTQYLIQRGHAIHEFDIVNGPQQDMTVIPNSSLEMTIQDSDFVFFLAFDVGGSRYLKKYQHTFEFIDNNVRLMTNTFRYLKKYNKPFVFLSTQMSNMNYSPYGILKNIGELYTKSLNGLVAKFWNVYGIEKDYEKSHVITDFICKGFDTGIIDVITNGEEERDFLYVEDCCEALEILMNNYSDFKSDDNLHVASFSNVKIKDIAKLVKGNFDSDESNTRDVIITFSEDVDIVQLDKRNQADPYIRKWWNPKTSISAGISKIYKEMKKEYLK